MKYMKIALIGMIATTASADYLPFIDKDFDLFLKRMVPSSVRAQFTKKYKDYQENSKKIAAAERVKRNYELFEKALDSLEVEHKAWAEDITAFLTDLRFLDQAYDSERVVVRDFLERYGLFKELSKEASVHITVAKQSRTKNAWKNVKTQLAQASHKVGDWFKSFKSHATV